MPPPKTVWRDRDGVQEKRCPTCEVRGRDPWHPIVDYAEDASRSSGLAIRCKECQREDWAAWEAARVYSPTQPRTDHRRAIERASYHRRKRK